MTPIVIPAKKRMSNHALFAFNPIVDQGREKSADQKSHWKVPATGIFLYSKETTPFKANLSFAGNHSTLNTLYPLVSILPG